MLLDDIRLFGALRQKLSYLDQRQRLISQNVANADTPGYRPSDLKPFTLPGATQQPLQLAGGVMTTSATEPGHMTMTTPPPPGRFKLTQTADSETTLDGNAVSLEDQMMKLSESRMDFDAAVGFYQKAMGLIQMAARAPGK